MVGGGGIWGFGCLLFLFVYLIVSFFLYFFAIGCFYVLSDLRVEMEELEEFCVDSKCWEVGGVFFSGTRLVFVLGVRLGFYAWFLVEFVS